MSASVADVESGAGTPPEVHLLGVRVHAFTCATLHATIRAIVHAGRRAVVANVNIHALNLAWEQPWFRTFLNRAAYVFCDGHGVMLAARLQGDHLPEKITYAEWLPRFAGFAANNGISLYLLGGRPGIAERAAERLLAAHPGLVLAGLHHGYFDKQPGSAENLAVVRAINAANPDVLLVAFGMPMQEAWLSENWGSLTARVGLTGGAALDYVAGALRRPPRWMTDRGLEWLGRMLAEPGRLWKRYLLGNPLFYWRWLQYRRKVMARPAKDVSG